MKKILQKKGRKSVVFYARLSAPKDRKALEAKVDAGLQRAIREYRETFRILTNYDRS